MTLNEKVEQSFGPITAMGQNIDSQKWEIKKRQKKLTTAFNQVPYTAMSRKGNSVTIENSGGTQYKRNITFVKKFFSKKNANDNPVEQQNQSETKPVKSGTENTADDF